MVLKKWDREAEEVKDVRREVGLETQDTPLLALMGKGLQAKE